MAPLWDDPLLRLPALAALVGGGAAVYGAAALALGAFSLADLRAGLRRRR
jgi:putative peptidoglycan lipid II flippase